MITGAGAADRATSVAWTQKEIIAIHEGAHAVVSANLGLSVLGMGMWADGNGLIGGFMRRDPIRIDLLSEDPAGVADRACHVIDAVVASAGYAVEDLLLAKVSSSATDDIKIALAIDGLGVWELGRRNELRKEFLSFARTEVRDSIARVLACARLLLDRVNELQADPWPWVEWSANVEGEELERLLSAPDVPGLTLPQAIDVFKRSTSLEKALFAEALLNKVERSGSNATTPEPGG